MQHRREGAGAPRSGEAAGLQRARPSGDRAPPDGPARAVVARLQATAGNRAVQALLRADRLSVQRDDPGGKKPDPAPADVPLIPPEWVRQPGPRDVLVAMVGNAMVALPAQGNFVLIRPQTPEIPLRGPTTVLSVPTVSKESVKMVGVGNQTGFLIDAGGKPDVLFPQTVEAARQPAVLLPGAFAAMTRSLGVTSVSGLVITHLHEDHVQSLVEIVRNNRIRPENIHFPESFASNRNAPSSLFAQLLERLRNDPVARQFGHGPSATYGVIRTPGGGTWWRTEIRVGEVTFEMYGISAAFRELEARRARGEPQERAQVGGQTVGSLADTASLITRVTHNPTGFRMLAVSDTRFPDLRLLKTAMGPEAYGEMLMGVRVVEGLGHHLGALESSADRSGLAEFLKDAQLRSGNLIVLAQSQETRSGRQFLNRSLIAALNASGIEVHVALEPIAGAVGTFTVDTDGRVAYSGGGRAESFMASAPVRAEIARLNQLREVESTLTQYGRFAEPQFRRAEDVRAAREALERVLETFMDTSAENVQRGAAGRARGTLRDPAAMARALAVAQATRAPVEGMINPAFMDGLMELRRVGPYMAIFEREAAEARQTGRLSDKGINALWEVAPEVAKRLLGESGLSRRAQAQAAKYVPGQVPALPVRSVALTMALVEIVNVAAPIVQQVRADRFSKNVMPALEDIMWWQEKGVFPAMEAVDDNWWPYSNEWTEDPKRIQKLLNDNEVSYLSLTGIPEPNWDPLTVWASAKLRNYRDWAKHILDTKAIRISGGNAMGEETFEYRTTRIHGKTIGFEVEEIWYRNPRLDKILQAAAKNVLVNSKEQIGIAETGPGALSQGETAGGAGNFGSMPSIFSDLGKPTGKWKFAPGVTPVLYTLAKQYRRTGYSPNSLLYTFPPSPQFDVPGDYVLVGGADFNTYVEIYATKNMIQIIGDRYGGKLDHYVRPNTFEVLLARKADLVEVK